MSTGFAVAGVADPGAEVNALGYSLDDEFSLLKGTRNLRPNRHSSILARMSNIYLELTEQFNRGRLRAIISSGQAVVVHRLAIMSKDGDWILREDAEAVDHVLALLARLGARYRFGAPLDMRWLAGGWSSHFELRRDALRLRTDFVTRPPRISREQLATLWAEA